MTAATRPEDTEPVLELTSVPAYGSFLDLKGVARHVDPELARVAVYIKVHGGWWTKPYWDSPTSALSADGSFSVSITTGGQDEQATEIATFLVPSESYPPGLRGEPALPLELFEQAMAHASVTRSP
jgi:hypothetical protein